jgi:hypothetical protein
VELEKIKDINQRKKLNKMAGKNQQPIKDDVE